MADAFTHVLRKILIERARLIPSQQEPSAEPPPPPYHATAELDSLDESDNDDDDHEDSETPSPLKLIINAAHSIQGSNNLVPTSPSLLADATTFSSLLVAALNQTNRADADADADAEPRRKPNIQLTINCGITVVGDRNVIGNVALKPKMLSSAMPARGGVADVATAVAGAKRKADEVYDSEDERSPKKVAARVDGSLNGRA